MEVNNFPLALWWNGEIIVDGENVSYKGGCESSIVVNSDISFCNLKSLILETLEVDCFRGM